MKIMQLDIEGFRSLKKVSWKPGDLNVIIGPNGSGKSNLLRMLELISTAAQGRLSKQIQSEGGMGAIVWDGISERISYVIACSPAKGDGYSMGYWLDIERLGLSSQYFVRHEELSTGDAALKRVGREALITQAGKQQGTSFDSSIIEEDEAFLMQASAPIAGFHSIQAVHNDIVEWAIFQGLRVDRDAAIRQAAISCPENRVAADGQNLVNVLHTLYTSDRYFKKNINDAMSAAFSEDFDELIFPPVAEQRVELQVRWKPLRRPQSATNLSDGTLRFLFLLTVLASPHPPTLIAIDEPETGLHPTMLPIIAEMAVEASTRTQVVFTTHSDQFLDAFRVTDTRPTTTVAKWQDGETSLTTLDDEQLAYWLEDYTLGNLFRSGQLENMAS